MGFHEFGQSLLGIVIVVGAMLVSFGGYQNQDAFESFSPQGVDGPNDINNETLFVSTSQTTPFATPTTGGPGQDNNPLLSLIFDQINDTFKLITELPSIFLDILTYIGIPSEIAFPILVFTGLTSLIYLSYYIAQVGVGALSGFFK